MQALSKGRRMLLPSSMFYQSSNASTTLEKKLPTCDVINSTAGVGGRDVESGEVDAGDDKEGAEHDEGASQ